jgi:perosamine synthetase
MIPHSRPCTGSEEAAAAARVLHSGMLAQGAEVQAFEAECAEALGFAHAAAVNSGTAALHLALMAAGIPENSTVAMPSWVCAALPQAVTWLRARPVLCDIGPDYNLDPAAVPAGCNAVIVPHLFGARAAMPDHPLIIEDLAQRMDPGETPPPRTGAAAAITSFYATKLMTTGEGGMVLTDDEAMAEAVRDRRDYDNRDNFIPRCAYKMTDFQAAIGRVQLRRLPGFLERRREIAQHYNGTFQDLPFERPPGRDHRWFRYVIATPDRDKLEKHLARYGVTATRPVYRPLHHYSGGTFPHSEAAHQQSLSLPIYPALSDEDTRVIIDAVRAFYE